MLEEENQKKLNLYIKQRCEYTRGLCILLNEVHEVLRKDEEKCEEENKAPIITPLYYPTKEELWKKHHKKLSKELWQKNINAYEV